MSDGEFLNRRGKRLALLELRKRLHVRLGHVDGLMRGGFPELHEKHRVVAFAREKVVVLQAAVFCEDFAAQTLRNDLPDKFPAPVP